MRLNPEEEQLKYVFQDLGVDMKFFPEKLTLEYIPQLNNARKLFFERLDTGTYDKIFGDNLLINEGETLFAEESIDRVGFKKCKKSIEEVVNNTYLTLLFPDDFFKDTVINLGFIYSSNIIFYFEQIIINFLKKSESLNENFDKMVEKETSRQIEESDNNDYNFLKEALGLEGPKMDEYFEKYKKTKKYAAAFRKHRTNIEKNAIKITEEKIKSRIKERNEVILYEELRNIISTIDKLYLVINDKEFLKKKTKEQLKEFLDKFLSSEEKEREEIIANINKPEKTNAISKIIKIIH